MNDSVIVEEASSVEALLDHVGEDVRNVLPEMEVEKQADSLDEKEVAIVMEIAEVIERGRKDQLPALKNVPKKKLLEKTANVNKVLSNSIAKTNGFFYAGAVAVTNRLGVKIEKWKRRLQNKTKELRKD